jgi:hypothetical protein
MNSFMQYKAGGDNGSTCGKALHIHNLYIVLIKGTKNVSTAYAVVTLRGGIGQLPVWKVGIPSVMYIVSRESICRLPGNHSVNQSRVEYTSLELRQIALEQIRVLPARLEASDRPSTSYTHSPRLSILSQHPTLNLRTNISLPRPPRCIILTHKGLCRIIY